LPYKGDTIVENDVWLGYEAIVMPGVKISSGAIVGTQSVVIKDVTPYAIVGGNPSNLIKHRFPDEVVHSRLEIAWWNWDVEKISRNLYYIVSADIDAFRNCI